MPRSKHLGQYPDAFQELIRQAATRRVDILCETEAEAKRLMGRLYGFNGALRRATEIKVGKATLPLAVQNDELVALQRMAEKVQFRVEGSVLIARPQDMDPASILIERALGGGTTQPITAGSIAPSAGFLADLKKPANE